MNAYTKLHRDDPAIEVFRGAFAKMRLALGVTGFGINEIRMPADFSGPEHDEVETGHEEVYVVLSGSGTAVVGGVEIGLREGDYLRVAPDATRQVSAGEDGLCFIAIGAKPSLAYDGRPTL
jgi:mannose-6-phosphate isomerase-like protein (cupin superfamily)